MLLSPTHPPPCSYGEFVVLDQHDHISVCKPAHPGDPAYRRLADFLRRASRQLQRRRAEEAERRVDHMEAAAI